MMLGRAGGSPAAQAISAQAHPRGWRFAEAGNVDGQTSQAASLTRAQTTQHERSLPTPPIQSPEQCRPLPSPKEKKTLSWHSWKEAAQCLDNPGSPLLQTQPGSPQGLEMPRGTGATVNTLRHPMRTAQVGQKAKGSLDSPRDLAPGEPRCICNISAGCFASPWPPASASGGAAPKNQPNPRKGLH